MWKIVFDAPYDDDNDKNDDDPDDDDVGDDDDKKCGSVCGKLSLQRTLVAKKSFSTTMSTIKTAPSTLIVVGLLMMIVIIMIIMIIIIMIIMIMMIVMILIIMMLAMIMLDAICQNFVDQVNCKNYCLSIC